VLNDDVDVRMSHGRLFHARGQATVNSQCFTMSWRQSSRLTKNYSLMRQPMAPSSRFDEITW